MIQYVNMNIKYAKFVKFEIARYARSSRDQGQDVSGLLRLRLERSMSARRALRPSSKAACYPLGLKKMVQLSHYALL